MPFCFLIQSFAEIGQSVNELWPKKRFSRWRQSPSWISEIAIFGHVTVIGFSIWCSVPNFIKIGQFFTEIHGDFTIFKMAAVRHVGFWKFAFFVPLPLSTCRSASSYKISLKSDNRSMIYGQKTIFNMPTAAILNFKNFNFWSRDCHRVQYLM